MKYLIATKDRNGYHYVVALDETNPTAPTKPFNYGPNPGKLAVQVEIDGETKTAFVDESDAEYQARIEKEIEQVSALFLAAWIAAGKPPALDTLNLDPPADVGSGRTF